DRAGGGGRTRPWPGRAWGGGRPRGGGGPRRSRSSAHARLGAVASPRRPCARARACGGRGGSTPGRGARVGEARARRSRGEGAGLPLCRRPRRLQGAGTGRRAHRGGPAGGGGGGVHGESGAGGAGAGGAGAGGGGEGGGG